MFPERVFAERRDFVEKMSAASPDFLASNAAALMRIVWELENSLALELQVIHGVRKLDVRRPTDVSTYASRFREYVESRGFSLERTSCHRIADIYYGQIQDLERGYSSGDRIGELKSLLEDLANADRQFTEEIEPFMNRSLAVVEAIRDASVSGDYEDAQRQKDDFGEEYRPEVERLKAAIEELNAAGMSLLAKL